MADAMKDLRPIIRQLRKQKWRVVDGSRGSEMKAYPPGGGRPVMLHRSPSDARWQKNLRALLRRAGADL